MWANVPVYSRIPKASDLDGPFVLNNAAKLLRWPSLHHELADPVNFLALDIDDSVGLSTGTAYDTNCEYIAFNDALTEVIDCQSGQKRYIAGWEYAAGESGAKLAKYGIGVEEWESSCILGSSSISGLRQVSELMKWFFIGSSETSSGVHSDPLGAHGWMFLFSGTKTWRIAKPPEGFILTSTIKDFSPNNPELFGWTFYVTVLFPGQLIFIPGGSLHSVKNGKGRSVAVTHNFVTTAQSSSLWFEINRALSLMQNNLDELCDHPEVDSLLFGVILSLSRASRAERERFAICDSPLRRQCLEIFSRMSNSFEDLKGEQIQFKTE